MTASTLTPELSRAQEFRQLADNVFKLHGEGKYREALEIAEQGVVKFPEEGRLQYWIACLQSRLGLEDTAIRSLEKALDRGYWWSESFLLGDPDLKPLQQRQDFKTIVARCQTAKQAALAKSKAELLVLTPPNYSTRRPAPLMIALHGRGGSAAHFAPYWKRALEAGFILSIPQSSQPIGSDSYAWDDAELSEKEITSAYAQVKNTYATNSKRVILTGFSQGGEWVIYLALKQKVPCLGFIAVAPSKGQFRDLTPLVKESSKSGVRGYLITGNKDFAYDQTKKLHDEMVKNNIPIKLYEEQGLGHDFPKDFDDRLATAIEFILG